MMLRSWMQGARKLSAALSVVLICATFPPGMRADDGQRLQVGVTLHPYYSFAANIVGDRADVVPLIGAGLNPHGYVPRADDMKRISGMDVLIVNGIGHDEWAFEIIQAAGADESLPLIYANDGVALIPVAGDADKVVNPHTFISTTASIQQVYTIATALGKLDPSNATYYRDNARAYARRIRQMKAGFMGQIDSADYVNFRCATMDGAYGYLMQEFGLQVTAVIEPRHGVQPTARQMADTIDQIKASGVNVMFAEKYFASKLSETIREATGVELYSFSHITGGEYTAGKYEEEMRANLDTLATAIRAAGS
jgi:zinc transport system substrate-binding protein